MFAVIAIVAILGISFVAFFILQSSYEQQLRSTIFEQQKERQIQYARSVAQNIGSDLHSLMLRLQTLEVTESMQDGNFVGFGADKLLQQTYNESLSIAKVDGIFLVSQDNKIVNYISSSIDTPSLIGYDLSSLPAYNEYLANGRIQTYSNAHITPEDDSLRIILFYPIYNQNTGQFLGTIRAPIIVHDFLSNYGNLQDLNSQYLVVLDRNATVIDTPIKTSIGKSFFSNGPQQGASQASNEHYQMVLSGKEDTAVFGYRDLGERINTGVPIVIDGKPEYFVFVVTPAASIYSQIDSLIAAQRIGFYFLQAGVAGGIAVSVYLLIRWSRALEKAVKDKTADLLEANEKLQKHDLMQREFVNVAAHELRTPVQPILAAASLLGIHPEINANEAKELTMVNKGDLSMIVRNAVRLERLSSDILDVSKIEGGSFRIYKQRFDLSKVLEEATEDASRHSKPNVEIQYESEGPIDVVADKQRILQVISNLINNAIRFTDSGNITVKNESVPEQVKVTVSDTGIGIDSEILPKLFTKFSSSTKSGSGTGLGLYISKTIIEAHGGQIWGSNNSNGGTTFGFAIPINASIDLNKIELSKQSENSLITKLAKEAFKS